MEVKGSKIMGGGLVDLQNQFLFQSHMNPLQQLQSAQEGWDEDNVELRNSKLLSFSLCVLLIGKSISFVQRSHIC